MTAPESRQNLWLAHATAAGLHAASRLNALGLGLALLNATLGYLATSATALGALMLALLAAGIQLWLRVRIDIDRKLFQALSIACGGEDLAALDTALVSLGWIRQPPATRTMAERARGTSRFLRIAMALTVLQWLLAMALFAMHACR